MVEVNQSYATWLVQNQNSNLFHVLKQFVKNSESGHDVKLIRELKFYHKVFFKTEYDYLDMFTPSGSHHKVSNDGINQILRLENFIDSDYDTFLCYEMRGKTLEDQMFKVERV